MQKDIFFEDVNDFINYIKNNKIKIKLVRDNFSLQNKTYPLLNDRTKFLCFVIHKTNPSDNYCITIDNYNKSKNNFINKNPDLFFVAYQNNYNSYNIDYFFITISLKDFCEKYDFDISNIDYESILNDIGDRISELEDLIEYEKKYLKQIKQNLNIPLEFC